MGKAGDRLVAAAREAREIASRADDLRAGRKYTAAVTMDEARLLDALRSGEMVAVPREAVWRVWVDLKQRDHAMADTVGEWLHPAAPEQGETP